MTGSEKMWAAVPGFEGFYEVSRCGSVKSLTRVVTRVCRGRLIKAQIKEKILKPGLGSHGYFTVALCKNGVNRTFPLHALVMISHVGPAPEGTECRHLDGVKSNNQISNLEWGFPKENQMDRRRHGTASVCHKNGNVKLTADQVLEIRRLRGAVPQSELASMFMVSEDAVRDVQLGHSWKDLTQEGIIDTATAGIQP